MQAFWAPAPSALQTGKTHFLPVRLFLWWFLFFTFLFALIPSLVFLIYPLKTTDTPHTPSQLGVWGVSGVRSKCPLIIKPRLEQLEEAVAQCCFPMSLLCTTWGYFMFMGAKVSAARTLLCLSVGVC